MTQTLWGTRKLGHRCASVHVYYWVTRDQEEDPWEEMNELSAHVPVALCTEEARS